MARDSFKMARDSCNMDHLTRSESHKRARAWLLSTLFNSGAVKSRT